MTRNPAATLDGEPAASRTTHDEGEGWFGLLRFVLLVILGMLAFRTFLFAPFSIPSESMLPRLMVGDYLLAAKWPYGYSGLSLPFDAPAIKGRAFARLPKRGDVVIFKHPVDGTDYVKRVIGLPGDVVGMTGGRVMLNGRFLNISDTAQLRVPVSTNTSCHGWARTVGDPGEPACAYPVARETLPGGLAYPTIDLGRTRQDDFGPVRVPADNLFVMGDNRDNSQDSRFPAMAGGGVGLVSTELLVGRAEIILWSTDGSAEWAKPWTWFTAARFDRIGTVL